jgi:DNA (cytosine-5)-methyltransferase 1
MKRGEIIVDSFAGGGGASLGIQWALGRSPDKAVNHDPEAIAMHAANHPDSEHFPHNVWRLDPKAVCDGRPVGLMWLSPDCTHFSKAKGGKPVSKKIRGLAWVAVKWAKAVRPRVIVLENVEEFRTWGPVLYGKPCPERKGQTYRAFRRRLAQLGYVVEDRELRACDYGAPTTRKRLFLIARCDGRPIVWPDPTHGPGRPEPWRTAAECIDWDLECPSIFLTKAEAKALGLRVKRPLAIPTLRRVGRGVWRFVIDSPEPFIVPMQHQNRATSIHEPLPTITTQRNKHVLITPFVAGVGGRMAQSKERAVTEPLHTATAKEDSVLVAPTLIQAGYGEDKKRNGGLGQPPRVLDLHAPLGTIVGGRKHALVASFLAKHYGDRGQRPGSQMTEPMDTVTPSDHHAVVAAHVQRDFGRSVGSDARSPVGTITGGGSGKTALVASHLLKLHGSSRQGQPVTEPLPTVRAGGNHVAEVRAFLIAYYSTDQRTGSLRQPMATVTPNDRFGLVTVQGQDYVIVDIGMRMLTPRERFRAQGFPDWYVIDVPFEYHRKHRVKIGRMMKTIERVITKPLTQEAQGRMVGNSVCPPLARAIVAANVPELARKERAA